jgi:hypothetical protein
MSDVQAGAIMIELKVLASDLKKNFAEATSRVDAFGKSTSTMAQKVNTAGLQVADAFDAVDKANIRMTGRIARLTGAMFAAQQTMQAFAGTGTTNKGAAAASAALSTFAGIALAIPHPVGVALAAVAGLGAGLLSFAKSSGEAITAGEKINAMLLQMKTQNLETQSKGIFAQMTSKGASLGVEKLKTDLEAAETALARAVPRIAELKEKIAASESFGFGTGQDTEELARISAGAEKLAAAVVAKRKELAVAEAGKDRETLDAQNKVLLEGTKTLLEAGLISPLEVLQVEATAAQKALEALLSAGKNADPTALGLLIDKAKGTKAAVESQKNLEGIADNFGSAFSTSLGNAILTGQKPMQALADIGGAMFSNSIGEAMKQVQAGMAAALKAASGGSDVLGGLFSAGLGVAGGLLSKLKGGANQSFASIQSRLESSQAVRGVLAGPSSIAINSLSENMERAFIPVRGDLAVMIGVLKDIRAKIGGGGSAPMQGAGRVTTT